MTSPNISSRTSLTDLLAAKGYLVADGAMGTQLFAVGLTAGDPPELWNIEHPEKIQAIHRSYLAAGSDIVLTNSFGGTHYRLALHDLQDRVEELNEAAARNARVAAEEVDRPVLVAGSMGPTGELLEPMGNMSPAQCEAAFAEQARGLTAGGADLLWIETMSDLDEVEAAVRGARTASDLPIAATMSFDTAGRTMMGVSGEAEAERLADLGLVAMGANCGNNLHDTEAAVKAIHASAPGIPIISKANAGIPEWSGESLSYDGTPEVMAAHAHRTRAGGVSIVGTCCGSTPDHIAKVAAVLSGAEPVPDVGAPPTGKAVAGTEDRMAPRRSRRRRRA
ncbi:MAG: betaine--homocysteine S-methyltransferase [Acidimicrobiales bacterium]